MLSLRPQQLDFWPTNLVLVDFQQRYAYELSPPLSNAERIVNDWFVASEKERRRRKQQYQAWKEQLYSYRCIAVQYQLKVYKQNGKIIVERIPYRGDALKREMLKHNMWVAK